MPMNDLNRWFFAATVRSRSRYSCSVSAGGNCRGFFRRMLAGSAASIRASSERAPMMRSISACCLSSGPMWRCSKLSGESMGMSGALLHEVRVLIIIEQIVDLAGIAELDIVQPRAVGIFVDQFRLPGQIWIHGDDLSRRRTVELGHRFHRLDCAGGLAL